MYNPNSTKASEFINHTEILETLDYAEKNKANRELIIEVLNKAAKMQGLNHREAMLLLACERT